MAVFYGPLLMPFDLSHILYEFMAVLYDECQIIIYNANMVDTTNIN